MTRQECLNAANIATGGHRQSDYGKPEDNFGRIAGLWSAYMGVTITTVDVCMMMAMLKAARVKGANGKPTDDCFVDLCGYAACAAEINGGMK